MVKNRYIKVKFQKEGVHKFPGADKDPKYATGNWDDVSFLGYPHRHVFHFYVTLGVTHNDRDVEFIQFKRELERLYTKNVLHLDYQSCEMIAEDLINYIEEKYPNRAVRVEVYEDDENGGILENDLFN
tara:strand:- start:10649 stop:11032 length:384 start_codon:yes stop_codon:yes gene_type:complete